MGYKRINMAQHLQTHADTGYLAIVLLLAYVLSSAPKFVRNLEHDKQPAKTEHKSFTRNMIKAGKSAVQQYVRAWERVQGSLTPAVTPQQPATLTENLPGLLKNN